MIAVILAGGLGTRISEETHLRPKPMIEIGGRPLLWHIFKIYSAYGINEFVVCCGYKGYLIKEYFSNYFLHTSDVTIDLKQNSLKVHRLKSEPWKITLVDTGEDTMTGGRLKRVEGFLNKDEDFCFTYGDGLSNINIDSLISFHRSHKKLATVTAVQPPGRYGALDIINSKVINFREKPLGDGGRISGGFFVLKSEVFRYIENDKTSWEEDSLKMLALDKELMAFIHDGFWQPMDTQRDKTQLENLWSTGNAPWKLWS